MTSGNLLLCQENSYQKESLSTVVSCEKLSDEHYQVKLDNSVLYPEGGGQPCDLGYADGLSVIKVAKAPGNDNHVLVELTGPLEVGKIVKCTVDWTRRYDLMQQHTAEHMISGMSLRLFKAEETGWAVQSDKAYVDLDLGDRPLLTSEQLQELEHQINLFVRTGAMVTYRKYTPDELNNLGDADKALLRGAPTGIALTLPVLRVVVIAGLEINTCGGTHLRSVAEVNLVKFLGCEKLKGNVQRIRFVAGDRALNYFSDCLMREAALTAKLSAPAPAQLIAQADKLLAERRDAVKKLETSNDELAGYWGKELVSLAAGTEKPDLIAMHRTGADMKFLSKTAETVLVINPKAFVFLSGDDGNAKVDDASGVAPIAGPFVAFGHKDAVSKIKNQLQTTINGKGGGKPGRMQGTAQNLENFDQLCLWMHNNL